MKRLQKIPGTIAMETAEYRTGMFGKPNEAGLHQTMLGIP